MFFRIKHLNTNIFLTSAALLFYICSCRPQASYNFQAGIDSLRNKWVPDRREGILDVSLTAKKGSFTLTGETDNPSAKLDILKYLEADDVQFTDSLRVLPDTSELKKTWGLVNVSVCNMRARPADDAEMVSQALMGTPLRILKKNNGWYLVQTPDHYLGWLDAGAFELLDTSQMKEWKRSSRVIFTEKSGDVFGDTDGKTTVSDITAGCILETEGKINGYYRLLFPDGRKGFGQPADFADFRDWMNKSRPDPDRICRTASRFMGTAYLWGGTSARGMDCSGFVKTVYFLNGLILPRDASLQFNYGKEISNYNNTDSLKKGDLLFFGSVRDGKSRATHVGIYIGFTEFIHEPDMVMINSLDSTRFNFSRYRRNTFIGARRIAGSYPSKGLQLVSEHQWYN